MQQYATTRDYLRALDAQSALAIVSMQMAADAFNIGRSAIANRLSAGSLKGVQIGRTRFVLASAINLELSRKSSEVDTVRAEIEWVARAGRTTTYMPIMAAIGRSTRIPNDRKVIGEILGIISRRSMEEHGFLLTALVYNSTLARPSGSFYGLAGEIDPSYERSRSEEAYQARQLQLIHGHYAAQRPSKKAGVGTVGSVKTGPRGRGLK